MYDSKCRSRLRLAIALVAVPLLALAAGFSPRGNYSRSHSQPVVSYLNISFPDSSDGFVTASKQSVFYLLATRDGGFGWRHFKLHFGVDLPTINPGQDGGSMPAIQFLDSRRGWIMGYSTTKCQPEAPQDQYTCPDVLYGTHDSGRRWRREISLGQARTIQGFQFVRPSTGWAITSRCKIPPPLYTVKRLAGGGMVCGFHQRILQTTNGGRSWRRVYWKMANVDSFHFLTPSWGWAVTVPGPNDLQCRSTVFVTSNAGASWRRILRLNNECNAIPTFLSTRDGWVLSHSPRCTTGGCPEILRKTMNGGKTWSIERGARTKTWTARQGFAQSIKYVDPKHGVIAFEHGSNLAVGGGIALTDDGGRTWTRSLPCRDLGPGATSMLSTGELWVTGLSIQGCQQSKPAGLLHSFDWGQHWETVPARV